MQRRLIKMSASNEEIKMKVTVEVETNGLASYEVSNLVVHTENRIHEHVLSPVFNVREITVNK